MRLAALEPWRAPARAIQNLLKALAAHPTWPSPPDYEDLAGILNTLATALLRNSNDPALHLYAEHTQVLTEIERLPFPGTLQFEATPLHRKVAIVEDFIGRCIARTIRLRPPLRGYAAFVHTLTRLLAARVRVNIVTTNYDCNLERLLHAHRIPFDDGFGTTSTLDGAGFPWRVTTSLTFRDCASVQLLKLHGSVNWHTLGDMEGVGLMALAACPPTLSRSNVWNATIRWADAPTLTPCMAPFTLRGALSKASAYSYDGYSQLLGAFERVLEASHLLVVAGSGWRDEALVARVMRSAFPQGKSLLVFDGAQPVPAVCNALPFRDLLASRPGLPRHIALVRRHLSDITPEECSQLVMNALSGGG